MVVYHRRDSAIEKRGSFGWLEQAGIDRIPKHQAGMFELNDLDRSPFGNVGGAGQRRVIGRFPGVILACLSAQYVLLRNMTSRFPRDHYRCKGRGEEESRGEEE